MLANVRRTVSTFVMSHWNTAALTPSCFSHATFVSSSSSTRRSRSARLAPEFASAMAMALPIPAAVSIVHLQLDEQCENKNAGNFDSPLPAPVTTATFPLLAPASRSGSIGPYGSWFSGRVEIPNFVGSYCARSAMLTVVRW
jgi:hypothetical protein